MILLVLNSIFNAFQNVGLGCAHLDMAAQHAGILFGITNTFGNLPGFIVPITIGIITQQHPDDRASWYWVWFIMAIFQTIGACIFVLFADMNTQTWAVNSDSDNSESSNSLRSQRNRDSNHVATREIHEIDEEPVPTI